MKVRYRETIYETRYRAIKVFTVDMALASNPNINNGKDY